MRRRAVIITLAIVAVAVFAILAGFLVALRPLDEDGEQGYLRVWKGDTVGQVLDRAESLGFLRSADAARLYARVFRRGDMVRDGTYELSASMSATDILAALLDGDPVRQMVRIREGRWMEEVAEVLEEHEVASRDEVLELISRPERWESVLGFRIPGDNLEGYLLPDTYDLPPLLGAEEAIERMLQAFVRKVYEPLGRPDPARLHELVIIGSMIEGEAGIEEERTKISGVIHNRLRIPMRLQIDATVIYGLRERRRLLNVDYRFEHPYNTYRIDGLPPGPICSPRPSSILAAASPDEHDYLFYVAMPDKTHLFAKTYDEHRRNIITSRAAFAAVR